MFKSFYKIEGNKLIHEQRDRKTKELQVVVERGVNDEGKFVEVKRKINF